MMPRFICLTDRHTKNTIFINVYLITSIEDLRTDPACTEDFHFTIIRCGNDVHEVKETIRDIDMELMRIKLR